MSTTLNDARHWFLSFLGHFFYGHEVISLTDFFLFCYANIYVNDTTNTIIPCLMSELLRQMEKIHFVLIH